jgi:AcrR family transcriptional regulator
LNGYVPDVSVEKSTAGQRVYGGLSPAERVARRREQFLDAAVEVFAGSTVADVCRAAKLSPRFFYDEFPSRELLFLATTDRIAGQVEQVVHGAVAGGAGARDVLAALAGYFTADPRTVRVALMESLATPEFRAQRRLLLASFIELAARLMRPLRGAAARERRTDLLSAGLLVGGVVEVLIAAATAAESDANDLGAIVQTRRGAAELVDHLTALFTAAAAL